MTHPGNPQIRYADLIGQAPNEIANNTGLPVVWCDHQATRRQRLHGITYPGTGAPWSSTHLTEVLEHMTETGHDRALFMAEDPRGHIHGCIVTFQPLAD